MPLAEDRKPEANRHIELRQYALQRHTRIEYFVDVSVSTLVEYWLVAD